MFEPLGDKLIVQPIEVDEMTEGGILIPDIENARTITSKVVAVGPGVHQHGHFVPTTVKPGDVVIYQHFSGLKFEYKNTEYHTVKESEIICKYSEQYATKE